MQTSLCPYCMSEVQGETCPYCGRNISCAGDPTHLPAGYILEDKRSYILGAALGQGGFGITYVGRDTLLDLKVAVKYASADEAFDAFNAFFDSFGRHEFEIERYFDHHLAYRALARSLHPGKNRIEREEIG